MKIKLIIEGLKAGKKYWPYIMLLLIFILMLPVLVISTLFSFAGWGGDDDPEISAKAGEYKTLAAGSGIAWQQLLAVDLAWHEMDQDELTPKLVLDEFVYYVEVQEPVYKEREVVNCVKRDAKGTCIETKKEKIQEIDHYVTKKEKRTRTFNAVTDRLLFTDEQLEMAQLVLETLSEEGYGEGAGIGLTGSVLAYEPLVRKYAIINSIEDQVPLLLAMIQQESGGRVPDVMQSSESAGKPRNFFTNPEDSIRQGVMYFADRLRDAKGDAKLALQSYNFGVGFISYALERGGYSKETAIAFSSMMAEKNGWPRYGDINYVDNVKRYFSSNTQLFDYTAVYNKMMSYLGVPYLLGGRNPDTGAVDCSGLIQHVFGFFGVQITGTAQSQYSKTKAIPASSAQPGDLVFFDTGMERTVGHVGMYLGNDQFINANSNGVSISSVSGWSNYYDKSKKRKYVFLGFRRITSGG